MVMRGRMWWGIAKIASSLRWSSWWGSVSVLSWERMGRSKWSTRTLSGFLFRLTRKLIRATRRPPGENLSNNLQYGIGLKWITQVLGNWRDGSVSSQGRGQTRYVGWFCDNLWALEVSADNPVILLAPNMNSNFVSSISIWVCRLTEEQYRPLLETMLDKDRVKTEQMLKTIGEERMRFTYFMFLDLSHLQEGWTAPRRCQGWLLRIWEVRQWF